MATWTTISNGAVAVGAIPSSTTVTALRDNPSAIAEAASGAPVVVAGWHPYNKAAVGDSNDGLIYDFAVNGVVADVVTPDFEDGYEYRLLVIGAGHNNGSARSLKIDLYMQTAAAYVTAYTTAGTGTIRFDVDAEILFPRVARWGNGVRVIASINSVLDTNVTGFAAASLDKVLKARLIFTLGSFNAGKVYLHRRREYASSL